MIKSKGTDDLAKLLKFREQLDATYPRLCTTTPTTADIALACVVWKSYPKFAAMIGDDRQGNERHEAHQFLARVHCKAAELLCAVANQEGLDGAAIFSSAEVCRELFREEPAIHRDGEFPLSWPECLGASRKMLTEHDKQVVRNGSSAYAALAGKLRLEAEADPQERLAGQPTAADLKKVTKGKRVNARMLEAIVNDFEVRGWTAEQWATHLRCAASTVAETEAWRQLKTHRDTLKAERAKAKRRRPKGSDLHRD